MQYRTLTGTGVKASRISLGTMTFGGQVNEADSIEMIDRSLDAGVNFIDTADIYNNGVSETILGKAIKGKRDGLIVASKVRGQVGEYEDKDVGLHRWHVLRGVEASLKRLQTDCLDICYLHAPDYETPIEETLAAADQLVRDGKVIYIGVSNYAAWQMCRALWICDRNNLHAPVLTQVVYNLLTRVIEQECLPFCRELGVGVTVYNPVASGLLTGKHDFSQPPAEGTRFAENKDYYGRYWHESNFQAAAALADIAKQAGISLTSLAFQWLAAQDVVDSIIIGASKMEQLEENLTAYDGELDQGTLTACDAVWHKLRGDIFQYNR
jgi:aryl-alcohol dehydrogenase-like predicted oxidoreductase